MHELVIRNRVQDLSHLVTELQQAVSEPFLQTSAEVARVIALGATHIHNKDEYGMQWTTLADPEGNEFCIGTPQH